MLSHQFSYIPLAGVRSLINLVAFAEHSDALAIKSPDHREELSSRTVFIAMDKSNMYVGVRWDLERMLLLGLDSGLFVPIMWT